MKKRSLNMTLNRETLLQLNPQEMAHAAAGTPLATWACYTAEKVLSCTTWSQDVCSVAQG